MRKAVSEIIVVVIILASAVSLTGIAYVFMSGLQGQATSEVQESGAESFKKSRSCLKITDYNFTEFYVEVKNCGAVELKDFVIFADGAIILNDNATIINPGKTDRLFFSEMPYEGIRTIKVLANYNAAYDAEDIPKILQIKNVNVSVG